MVDLFDVVIIFFSLVFGIAATASIFESEHWVRVVLCVGMVVICLRALLDAAWRLAA